MVYGHIERKMKFSLDDNKFKGDHGNAFGRGTAIKKDFLLNRQLKKLNYF